MAFLPQLEHKANQLGINLKGFIDRSHDKHDFSEAAISAMTGGVADSHLVTRGQAGSPGGR
jgi:hypothetical protein